MQRTNTGYPIILGSILMFSRMSSTKLKPKLTVDIDCIRFSLEVHSLHVKKKHKGLLFACSAGACVHMRARTHTNVTSPPRADPNFLMHFTAKGEPSIFEWSTLSM